MSKIIVLFEVVLKADGKEQYLTLAERLKAMLSSAEGFLYAERFQSLSTEGKLLSMNIWESEEAVEKWRNQLTHRMSQSEGKNRLFESYKITVCQSLREYTHEDRASAPEDSNGFFRLK